MLRCVTVSGRGSLKSLSKQTVGNQTICNNITRHQYRSFGLLSKLFAPKYESYDKKGRCVILNQSEIDVEKETDSASINVGLSIEGDYSAQYDPKNQVIIKQYGSCLTTQDFPGVTLRPELLDNSALKPIPGRAFSGIIEYIPPKVKDKLAARARLSRSQTFVEGDRIWGLAKSAFGQQWSEYAPVDYNNIFNAPDNIPLHFCAMFPLSILLMQQCMRQSKMSSFSDFADKKILFIGSGKESLINVGLPLMYQQNATQIDILTSSDRHDCVLAEHFQDIIDDKVVNVKEYRSIDLNDLAIKHEEKIKKESNKDKNEKEEESNNFEFDRYDIVIDSTGREHSELHQHVKFCTKKGKFWIMHTPMADIMASNKSKIKAAFKMQQWWADAHSQYARLNGVKVVLGTMPHTMGNGLHEWAVDMREVSAPIFIDKMYPLDQVQHALNYVFDNDESILGENIGIIINEEEDFECPDASVEWYPVQLDDIAPFMEEYNKNMNMDDSDDNGDDELTEQEKENTMKAL